MITKDKIELSKTLLQVAAATISEIIMNHKEKIDTAYGQKTFAGIADLICRKMSDNKISFND